MDAKDANGNDLNGAGGFQPGSTMKPFTFAEWLNEGKSMTTMVDASKRELSAGLPLADHLRQGGSAATAQAAQEASERRRPAERRGRLLPAHARADYGLYNSINTATFAAAAQLDFCGIQKMVNAVGLHSGAGRNAQVNMHQLGNLLGATGVAPLTMANAFATFANDGTVLRADRHPSVTDVAGKQLPAQAPVPRRRDKPEVARGVNEALQDVLNEGSGSTSSPNVQKTSSRSRPRPAPTTTTAPPGCWATPPASPRRRSSVTRWRASSGPGRNVTINGKFYDRH